MDKDSALFGLQGKAKATAYNTIHQWANRNLKRTGVCEHCGKKGKTQWANIDHQYRYDETEWIEFCPRCHYDFDIAMGNRQPRLPKRMYSYAWITFSPSHLPH